MNNAPAGSSIIKGHDNSTIYKPSPTILYVFTSNGMTNYIVNGPGSASNAANGPLVVHRGFTYDLKNNAGGHPLEIRTSDQGSEYTGGISGSKTALQVWTVPFDAPNTLYYQCTAHPAMIGTITVK